MMKCQRTYRIKLKEIIFLALVLFSCHESVFGQQDAQYTQYMYNTLAVNPAYAGSRGSLGISALHRSQWIGMDGAPNTQTLNINGPLSESIGLGISIVHDEIGNNTNQNTYFDGAFSYTVPLQDDYKLSFGLKVGGHFLNIDFNKLRNYNARTVPVGDSEIYKKFAPNIGAGIYLHSPKFYLGISVPNFLETEHFQDSGNGTSNIAKEKMNWYLISGYVFDLSPTLKFKPAALLKGVQGINFQADFSANFLIHEKFTLGAAYRWDSAISALFGFQVSEVFMLGLAYDREISELGGTQFNDGSFELFLRYEFKKKDKIDLTPRFF